MTATAIASHPDVIILQGHGDNVDVVWKYSCRCPVKPEEGTSVTPQGREGLTSLLRKMKQKIKSPSRGSVRVVKRNLWKKKKKRMQPKL